MQRQDVIDVLARAPTAGDNIDHFWIKATKIKFYPASKQAIEVVVVPLPARAEVAL